jgi:multiple sugar transport system permease protein
MKLKKLLTRILFYSIIVFISLSIIFPIYWLIATSIKAKLDIFTYPPKFLFFTFENNYYRPFILEGYTKLLINSIIVSIGNVILVAPIAFIAAYALSRYKIYGGGTIYFWALTNRMAPPAAFIIPYYLIFTGLGLYDTQLSLIIVYSVFNLPFAIWLLKAGVDSIPRAIDDAAIVDGCSIGTLIVKIMLPLSFPSLAATSIMVFFYSWNEYLLASILTSYNARTITTGLTAFISTVGIRWGEMAAVGTVCLIPTTIVVIILQKYIVSGLTMGAVKG